MATVFWDTKGAISVDYLEKGKTITSAYYSSLLVHSTKELKTKRAHFAKKKILFHRDNVPCHSSALAASKLKEFRYELLPHPPYFPDLPRWTIFFSQI